MSWHGILGHDDVVDKFVSALKRRRLASSFLFVGPAGIGKRTFAMKFAQALLCQARPEDALDPCEQCPSCVQVLAGTHPDVEVVCKPADKSFLPLELLVGDKDHRSREGLCHSLSLKPFMGGRRIAIIDDADYLNAEGANSLLKTLEEPPPRSVLILIGTSSAKQLPTIRSRCQLVRFRPLPTETVAQLLASTEVVDNAAEARRLADFSGGSLQTARELADPQLWTFRAQLYQWLAEPVLESVRVGAAVLAFVDAAGKDAPARRNRTRQILHFAAQFFQQMIYALSGAALTGDRELRDAARQAAQNWPPINSAAAACLDRTLEAAEQVDRNVHQAILLECWLDDLARFRTGG